MQPITLNAKDIKQQVSLVDLLAALGYEPTKRAGSELVYHSMLRDSDIKPSFSVNGDLNVWYDHVTAKGGNIIDFAMAYWKLTFTEALKKIAAVSGKNFSVAATGQKRARKHARKLPHYCVEDIRPLGNNPVIEEYITGRGIWEAALTHLQEVYYFVEDEQKNRKQFFAAGWQNELGSWEVSSLHFKGCLGHKAITFIGRNSANLAVFNGCFNYLSWLTENPSASDSILILNSPELLQSAIRKAKDFLEISLFFKCDYIGRQDCADFIQALPQAVDRSAHYKEFIDYNEMLVFKTKKTRPVSRGL